MYYSRSSSIFKHYTFIHHHHLVTFKRKKALYLFVITYLKCVKKKKDYEKKVATTSIRFMWVFFKKKSMKITYLSKLSNDAIQHHRMMSEKSQSAILCKRKMQEKIVFEYFVHHL